ncbi:MAG: hypothetical protein DWQ10_09015 [Calditrichaeota bacterium]|nr:MAG: hypothetical protein DWQ10_09015 [Calditrichota bacterium]
MTKAKNTVFTIIMLLVPVLFFVLLEIGLRIFGGYQQEPLVVKTHKNGKEVYQINQNIARRYFDPNKVNVPAAAPETFNAHKTASTFRIFCLGGSTTAGFPFDCQVSFPQQLRYLLQNSYPRYRFEVINLGISAVNSYTVLDLLPDVLELQPDLILVYMGHNEFYGAYGSASSFALPGSDQFIRFYLKLQKLHTIQFLQSIVSLFSISESTPKKKNLSLMAAVVQDQQIAWRSENYQKTMQVFSNNLEIILNSCCRAKEPVIMSNLVSNIRDLKPFSANIKRAGANTGDGLAIAYSLFNAKNYTASAEAYRQLLGTDASDAGLWFNLGKSYIGLGDSVQALQALTEAKDRDQVRFRAAEDANLIIKTLASETNASFIDMQTRFAAHAQHGLIGDDLICNHLHPNPNGYYLMAKAFYEQIQSLNMLNGLDSTFFVQDKPYFVTDLDWDIGLLKIFEMVNSWPFEEKNVTFDDYKAYGEPKAAEIARNYLFEENIWSRAHYKMADAFIKQKAFEKARLEYLAVSVFVPEDSYPYNRVAKTYEYEGRWRAREIFLKKELQYSPARGMVWYQIAMAQFKQKQYRNASQSMLNALKERDLNQKERLNARWHLAGFYYEANQVDQAISILKGILRDIPNFTPAKSFLQKIAKLQQ